MTKVISVNAPKLQGVWTRRQFIGAVQLLFGSTIAVAFLSGNPYELYGAISGSDLREAWCDVSSIDNVGGGDVRSLRWLRQRFQITVVPQRLPDFTWDFHMLLRNRRRGSTFSWRIHANTCDRAIQRTTLKLGLITEALRLARLQPTKSPPLPEVWATPPSPPVMATATEPSASPPQVPPTAPESTTPPAARSNPAPPPPTPAPVESVSVGAKDRRLETPTQGVVRLRTRMAVRLAGRGGYGVLPQGAFGGGQLHGVLVIGRARLELGVGAGFAGTLVLKDNVTRRPIHLSVQLAGCVQRTRRRLDLRGCLGLEVGTIVVLRLDSLPWPRTVHLFGAPSLTWWFHARVGLYGSISAGRALVRPNYYVGPASDDQAIAVPPLAVSGTLGLEFRRRSY